MSQRPILLATETISRELDFQLMFASKFVTPQTRFFIGRQNAMRTVARYAKNGVFVGKAFDPYFPGTDLSFYRLLKSQGFAFAHLDEEGAVYPGREERWRTTLRRRLDVNVLAKDDFVCTWGDFQRGVYADDRPPLSEQIRATGHPRFDLYLPENRGYFDEDAQALRDRYGDFLLINTNLSYGNHGTGVATIFSPKYGFDPKSDDKRIDLMEHWAHSMRVIVNIVKLANRLSIAFPKMRVVMRPHPSENLDFYKTIFRDIPNVTVIREGSVAPWLLAARALIHDGCTTAIEAYLGDAHVINYVSVSGSKYERFLPNQFGVKCETEDEVIELVRGICDGSKSAKGVAAVDAVGASLLTNLREPATPLVSAVINEGMSTRTGAGEFGDVMHFAHSRADVLVENAKQKVRPFSPLRMRMNRYVLGKFPGFDADDVARRMQRIERITGRHHYCVVHSPTLISISAITRR